MPNFSGASVPILFVLIPSFLTKTSELLRNQNDPMNILKKYPHDYPNIPFSYPINIQIHIALISHSYPMISICPCHRRSLWVPMPPGETRHYEGVRRRFTAHLLVAGQHEAGEMVEMVEINQRGYGTCLYVCINK